MHKLQTLVLITTLMCLSNAAELAGCQTFYAAASAERRVPLRGLDIQWEESRIGDKIVINKLYLGADKTPAIGTIGTIIEISSKGTRSVDFGADAKNAGIVGARNFGVIKKRLLQGDVALIKSDVRPAAEVPTDTRDRYHQYHSFENQRGRNILEIMRTHLTCSKGHQLYEQRHRRRDAMCFYATECDACGRSVAIDEVTLHCARCNYDLCKSCQEPRFQQALQEERLSLLLAAATKDITLDEDLDESDEDPERTERRLREFDAIAEEAKIVFSLRTRSGRLESHQDQGHLYKSNHNEIEDEICRNRNTIIFGPIVLATSILLFIINLSAMGAL